MSRWNIIGDGKAIAQKVTDSHTDDIEMSGFYVSYVVRYGADDDGLLKMSRHPVFPTLRKRPNDTHASYQCDIDEKNIPQILIDGKKCCEKPVEYMINGTLNISSVCGDIAVTRICYPSSSARVAYEKVTITNNGSTAVTVSVTGNGGLTGRTLGCMGICVTEISHDFYSDVTLAGGESTAFHIIINGRLVSEECDSDEYDLNPDTELDDRYMNVEKLTSPLKLDTGCATLDTMFRFAKLRAGESVFNTKCGLLHSPGGFSYYAAVWCNDQVEYAGPWFAYTGDADLIEASYNAYKLFEPFMDDSYDPIPSSVIAEGVDFWNGARDRGDAAMFIYGASHFALSCGDRDMAEQLWAPIKWSAEFCESRKNEFGVIASDSDELEGRFPSGSANLCTSTLCYSGLRAASILAQEFGETERAALYTKRADELAAAIEEYFGGTIHGFDTYKYYEGNTNLRSWLCMPLCVGLHARAEATVDALMSEYLMTKDGLLTAEGSTTVWDRSTLYGLRGIFASGFSGTALSELLKYSENRLLGERVPYAVEAYPEGGKRHLSGESALYCKVITEGILDIKPKGFRKFEFHPNLPAGLDHLYLTGIRAYGGVFDICIEKDCYTVKKSNGALLSSGKLNERVVVSM